MQSDRSRLIARLGLAALQWCLFTIGLGAVVLYSAPDLDGLISPNFDLAYMMIAALLLAGLLGAIVRPLVIVIPLAALMCIGSTVFFAFTMFAPTWDGSVVRTTDLENYVTTRMLLFMLVMAFPALIGALIGNLAGGMLDDRHEILTNQAAAKHSWWELRAKDDDV